MLRPGYISLPRTAFLTANREKPTSAGPVQLAPLTFPLSRSVLWDHRVIGPPVFVNITQCRNPLAYLDEASLRLALRLAQDGARNEGSFMLVGSLASESDGCGVVLNIDVLDSTKGSNVNQSLTRRDLAAGRLHVPFLAVKDGARQTVSVEHYMNSLQLVDFRCRADRPVDINHFVSLRLLGSWHASPSAVTVFQLTLSFVYPSVGFRLTPVNSLPIIPTALSKNLSGPLSISDVQGAPKSGYLSMDNTRKLLLVLESDPKVHGLPLVGIWIAGLANIEDPFVWASAVRYVFNSSLKDRVCLPPDPFLAVLFSTLHSKPEFYECVTTDGRRYLDFALSTCHDVVQLSRDKVPSADSAIELELTSTHGEPLDAFHSALQMFRMSSNESSAVNGVRNSGACAEESGLPSPIPVQPHSAKEYMIQPSVPELTLLFDGETGGAVHQHQPLNSSLVSDHPSCQSSGGREPVGCSCCARPAVIDSAAERQSPMIQQSQMIQSAAERQPQLFQKAYQPAVGLHRSAEQKPAAPCSHRCASCVTHTHHNPAADAANCSRTQSRPDTMQHGSGPVCYSPATVAEPRKQHGGPSHCTGPERPPNLFPSDIRQLAPCSAVHSSTVPAVAAHSNLPRGGHSASLAASLHHAASHPGQLLASASQWQNGQFHPSSVPQDPRFTTAGHRSRVPCETQGRQSTHEQTAGRRSSQNLEPPVIAQVSSTVQQHVPQQLPASHVSRMPLNAGYVTSSDPVQCHHCVCSSCANPSVPVAVMASQHGGLPANSKPASFPLPPHASLLPSQSAAGGGYRNGMVYESERYGGLVRPPSVNHDECEVNLRQLSFCSTERPASVTHAGPKTVNDLLRTIPVENFEWSMALPQDHVTVDGFMESVLGHNSGSTDSGLQVSDSTASGDTPPKTSPSTARDGCNQISENVGDGAVRTSNNSCCQQHINLNKCVEINTEPATLRHRGHNGTPVAEQFSGGDRKAKLCSVAVNTSFYWPPEDDGGNTQRGNSSNVVRPPADVNCWESSCHSQLQPTNSVVQSSSAFPANVSLSHIASLQRLHAGDGDMPLVNGSSPATCDSMADVSLCTPPPPVFPNPSEDSVVSEMIMDMPEYTALSPEKTEMFGEARAMHEYAAENMSLSQQVNADNSWEQQSVNCRSCSQLEVDRQIPTPTSSVNNLAELSFGSSHSAGSVKVCDAVEMCKAQLLKQHAGETVSQSASFHQPDNTCLTDDTVMLNNDILPKLNYVSMVWNDQTTTDSRSPADMTSVVSAVNAAAIKYLDDRQLVRQAYAATGRHKSQSRATRSSGQSATSSSNASIYGVKSANLSLASRKYFEKHQLGTNRPAEPQSAVPRQMPKSKMEDLLNSISSQVNGLQVTMSPEHLAWDAKHHHDRIHIGGQQSDLSDSSFRGNESSRSMPTGRQHVRRSFDNSAVSDTVLNDSGSSRWNHLSHSRSSLDGSQVHHRYRGKQLRAIDRTLEFDDNVVIDNTGSPL